MLKNKRKCKRRIIVVPQQHWDPYWKYDPKVSERMGVNNVRKALDIIKENPEFKYVVAQTYLYELFKKYFPDRQEEFRQCVQEGKIELACGGHINPDFNLPSGESLIRNLAYCQKIWQKDFGIKPKVAWIQDSFGQSGQLPQIFRKLGIRFHTAKRGMSRNLPATFVWRGVDRTGIIFDRQPLGHHGITHFPWFSMVPNRVKPSERFEKAMRPFLFPLALMALYLPDPHIWIGTKSRARSFREALNLLIKSYPSKTIFIPHGFGADGAMPVDWITYFCQIYSRLSGHQMKIGSAREFLEEMEKIKSNLQIIKGELNGPTEVGEAFGALPGSYSTRIDVKQRARKMERLLYLSEFLETIRLLTNNQHRDITSTWKEKFLVDFHDSICGTLTTDNYKLLRQKAKRVIKRCEKLIKKDISILAPEYSVLNILPWSRDDIVKIDNAYQLVKADPTSFSPVIPLIVKSKFGFNGSHRLTTPFYRVKWSNKGLELYRKGRKITGPKFARIRLQNENGDSYFWDVSEEEWNAIESVKLVELKGIRAVLKIKSKLRKTKITQLIYFYLHTPRVDFETEIDNREKNIRLQIHLPFIFNKDGFAVEREIPAGFIKEGESDGQAKWKDVFGEKYAYYDNIRCIQNWLYLGNSQKGIAVFNDGLPEHEIVNQTCFLTLLRCIGRVGTLGKGLKKFNPPNVPWAAGSPHPIPLAQMQGKYKFRYAVCPVKRGEVAKQCYEFLFPLIYCQGNKENKNLPLFSVSDKSIIPLAIKVSDNHQGIIIRLLETEGRAKTVQLKFSPDIQVQFAELTNLLEEPIVDLTIIENIIQIPFKSQEIVTIVLNFKNKKPR